MNLRVFVGLSASVCLLGCTLAPKYQRPAAPVPAAWPAAPSPDGPAPSSVAPGVAGTAAADLGWKNFFNDPQLQALITMSLQENRDLRVAINNVEIVSAQYRIQRAELLPIISANGSLSRTRTPATLLYPGQTNPSSVYSVNGGVSAWELDIFGRIRSLKDQALELYFAQEQTRRNVQLSLVSLVATEYFSQRALAEAVAVAQQTLKAQEDSLHLTQRAYEVGTTSELDFRTGQAQVASARSDLASYRRQYAETLTALSVLVGGPLPAELVPPAPLPGKGVLAELPAGLPSELLNRRPDILEAEHRLEAFNANIGAARAAFFPRISLTGSAGTESLTLSGLFKPGSAAWVFNPQVTLPIFEGGANVANLAIAKLEKLSAAAQYEKTIQTAFKEVSDALTARTLYDEQIAAQNDLVEADRIGYTLAEARYRHGVDSYLIALDAQRSLYAAQQTLIQSRLARLTNLVTLYRALGGGWNEQTPSEVSTAPAPASAVSQR